MNSAIDIMMNEHQLILQVLASLQTVVAKLEQGESVPRSDIADFTTFYRDFADKCHHCKEEDRLFVAMNQFGFPKEYGPVAVMLSEHTEGRSHVRELWQVGQGTGELTPDEVRTIIHHAGEFIPLLAAHIAKEDNILYPMARSAIPAKDLSLLDTECQSFESQVMAPGEVEKLRALADRLTQTYPGTLESLAAVSGCFGGCHHH